MKVKSVNFAVQNLKKDPRASAWTHVETPPGKWHPDQKKRVGGLKLQTGYQRTVLAAAQQVRSITGSVFVEGNLGLMGL